MKLRFTLPAVLMAALLLTTACGNGNDDNKDRYATNKAGERLVEKIESIYEDGTIYNYYFTYNNDGTIQKIVEDSYDDDTDFECDRRIFSFEKKNNTLYLCDSSAEIYNTSFDLNKNGFIVLDRGYEGTEKYRFSYDESGKFLHNVFKNEELIRTFEWEEGNIVNDEVSYTDQPHRSNIDWCAYFQTWRRDRIDEDLVDIPSICNFWGFSDGYLGNKCKSLPAEDKSHGLYTYDFTEDGFISAIYVSGEWSKCEIHVTYLEK